MHRRTVMGLGAAAATVTAAAVLLTPDRPEPPAVAGLAFPDLADRLAGAVRIEVRRGADALVLERGAGDAWALPVLDGAPARPERVRELLVGLTELRLVEPRTADPAQLDRLGLEDPALPGATSALLRVLDARGTAIAELVTGRRRVRTAGNVPESIHVRRPDESQAWLAEGRLPVDADPQLWLDRDLANLSRDRVLRIETRRDGAVLELARDGEPDAPLRAVRPAAAPPLDAAALDEVARALEFLTFEEARRDVAAPDAAEEAIGESRFALTDNLAVSLTGARREGQLWVRLTATGDDEAARYNARWGGRRYRLPAGRERGLLPRLEDLLARPPDGEPARP